MTDRPFRSNRTTLTGDELLLADALAVLGPLWPDFLRQEDYAIHINLPYTHGIADARLGHVLDQMRERDRFALVDDEDESEQRLALTPEGGALWETERIPVWPMYCAVLFGEENGKAVCSVTVYDKKVGEQFIRVANDLGYELHLLPEHRTVWEILEQPGIRHWQETDSAWSCQFEIVRTDDSKWEDWSELESRRTWWNTLDELQKFLPNKTPGHVL